MGAKAKPLQGHSEFLKDDGTAVPVQDMDPQEWKRHQQVILQNIGRAISDFLSTHPERKAAFGLKDKNAAVVCLSDLLKGAEDNDE